MSESTSNTAAPTPTTASTKRDRSVSPSDNLEERDPKRTNVGMNQSSQEQEHGQVGDQSPVEKINQDSGEEQPTE
jgi:hypothetical protein